MNNKNLVLEKFKQTFNLITNLRKTQSEKTLTLLDSSIVSVTKTEYLENHPKHFFHIVDPSPWAILYSYCSII